MLVLDCPRKRISPGGRRLVVWRFLPLLIEMHIFLICPLEWGLIQTEMRVGKGLPLQVDIPDDF